VAASRTIRGVLFTTAVLLASAGPVRADGPNFLPNGGFEDGVMRWRVNGQYPNKVTLYAPDIHIDMEVFHSGLKSLRIAPSLKKIIALDEAGGGGIVGGMPGKHYTAGLPAGEYLVEMYVRARELRPHGAVTFSWRVLKGRREIAKGKLGEAPLKESSFIEEWRLLHKTVNVPADGRVEVTIETNEGGRVGNVWVDDVSVRKLAKGATPPAPPAVPTVTVLDREGRTIPVFTNEAAVVKVRVVHVDTDRSYRLVTTVTDYWDEVVREEVFDIAPGSGAEFEREVRIERTGWYTVLATLEGADTPVQQGTKLAVIDFDKSRIPDRDTLFGLWLPWYPSDVEQLGLTWVNGMMRWCDIEKEKGKPDWSRVDHALDLDWERVLAKGDARAYQVVMGAIPAWAAKSGKAQKGTPGDWEEYRAFIKKLVAYTGEKVDVWDVMNEAMGSKWNGTTEELFMLHKVTAEAVKSVNPKARGIGPAVGSYGAGNYEKDTELMLRMGLAKYVDGIAIHPYRPAFPDDQGPENTMFEDEIIRWGLMAQKYGLSKNDLWITEVGVPVLGTASFGGTRRQQAEWMVRMHLAALAQDLPCLIWFKGRPSGSLGPQEEALIDKGARPRRMYAAYVAMTQQLAAARFKYYLDGLGATGMGQVYERDPEQGAGPVLVLWDARDGSRASIDVGAAEVTVVDIVGGKRTVKTTDGVLDICLTPDVQYVLGAGNALFMEKTARTILPDRDLIRTDFGKTETVQVRLANLARERKSLRFVVDAPAGWMDEGAGAVRVALAPGETKDVSFSFAVPADDRWGLNRITLKLVGMGRVESVALVRVHIAGPKE